MKRVIIAIGLVLLSVNLFSETKSLSLDLMYRNLRIETTKDSSGKIIESKVIDNGESNITLQLLELTKLKLNKEQYHLVEPKSEQEHYKIEILPHYLPYGSYYVCSILIKIYTPDNKLLDYTIISDDKNPKKLTEQFSDLIVEYVKETI